MSEMLTDNNIISNNNNNNKKILIQIDEMQHRQRLKHWNNDPATQG
jgi:hypothetical protein